MHHLPRPPLIPSFALAASAALAVASLSSTARAGDGDTGQAERLYDEALELMDKARFDEACPKLEKSYAIDAAVGTRFYLADCYEQQGKLATALSIFEEVERTAHSVGKRKLEDSARNRAETLLPKVPTLRFVIGEPRAVVALDGTPLKTEVWQKPVPVDPGEHAVEVTAVGKKPWSTSLRIASDSKATEVRVAALTSLVQERIVVRQVTDRGRIQKIAAIASGGVGVVGLGLGTFFGFMALDRRNRGQDLCGAEKPGPCASQEGVDAWSDAKTAGNVSTLTIGLGAAFLVAGGVLWFTAPKAKASEATRAGVRPGIGGATFVF